MLKIGIDLGGTSVRAGLVEDRAVRVLHEAPTPADGTQEEVLEQIYALLDRLPTEEVEHIGAGVPSMVDAEEGIVYDVQNIPSWTEVPLGAQLRSRRVWNGSLSGEHLRALLRRAVLRARIRYDRERGVRAGPGGR